MIREPDELPEILTNELGSLGADDAGRLCQILRGLFSCMRDLEHRVAELEARSAAADFQRSAD